MNRKDFDKVLQERLNSYSSPYSEHIWNNLEKELDRNELKGGFLWNIRNNLSAFLLIFAVSCIAALGYYQITKNNIEIPVVQDARSNENSNDPVSPVDKVEINVKLLESKDINAPVSIIDNKDAGSSIQSSSKSKSDSRVHANSLRESNSTGNSNMNGLIKNSLNSFSGFNQVEPSYSVNSEQVSNDKTEEKKYNNSELRVINSQRIMSVNSNKKHAKLFDHSLKDSKRNCPSFGTNVPDYYIEIFGSPDYTFKSLSTKDVEYANYKKARLNSESELLGYSLGIRGELALRSGFSIKTGLVYSNIREKFHHLIIGEEIIKYKYIPTDTIYNASTTYYVVWDTVSYKESGNRTITSENSIKTVEVPFLVGYQFDFTRWSIQLNAGVAIQLTNIQRGNVLSPGLEPVSYNSNEPGHFDLYKRQWGLSFYSGLQFGYKLNSLLQVIIEPYANYYPKSVTVDGYPISQKMLRVGTNIGLKYRL